MISRTDAFGNHLESGKIRLLLRATLVLWGILVASVATVCVLGTQAEYKGWVSPKIVASSESFHVYQGDLETDSELFRGNDLFAVSDPTLVSQLPSVQASQAWNPYNLKGNVSFQHEGKHLLLKKLPVTYSLNLRWEKLLPLFVGSLGIIGLANFFYFWRLEPRVFYNPWLVRSLQVILVVASVGLIVCMIFNPVWKYGDNAFILRSTVQGKPLPQMIFPATGRFYPLGLIDLNLMIPFGDAPLVYLIERVVMFVILLYLIFRFARQHAGKLASGVLTLWFITSPGLFQVYSDAIYPEALLSLLLAIFFSCYFAAVKTQNRFWLVLACLSASFATYCKEPVFGLFVVFAMPQLIFAGGDRQTKLVWPAIAYLILNGIVFLSVYWVICGSGSSYADIRNSGADVTRWSSLTDLMGSHLCFVLALLIAAGRLVSTFRKRFFTAECSQMNLLIYDSALYAGCAYVCAFAIMRLTADYYIVPAYVCWTIACSGYVADLLGRYSKALKKWEQETSQLAKRGSPSLAIFPLLVGGVILICLYQTPQVVDSVSRTQRERSATQILRRSFAALALEGYEFCAYVPESIPSHGEFMQNYRIEVLGSFDLVPAGADAPDQDSPLEFERLERADGLEDDKLIVLHDPAFSLKPLNDRLQGGDYLQQIHSLPRILGGRLYALASQQEAIERVLDSKGAARKK